MHALTDQAGYGKDPKMEGTMLFFPSTLRGYNFLRGKKNFMKV